MKNKIFISLSIFFLLNNFFCSELKAKIDNYIVVKVGSHLITSIDIQNEIITNLIINKIEITQENINNNKNISVKNLINNSIKKNEVDKFEIKNYNEEDLQKYINEVAKNFNTNTNGLKEIFITSGINYDAFVEKHETELLWNTLIFNIYKNQFNINIVEVENDVEKILKTETVQYNLSEIEIPNIENNKDKLNNILELIKKEGFETVAKKFSIATSAEKGGLIGWFSNKVLSKKYLEQIKKLNINEISSPIVNENSFFILKINDIKKNINEIESDKIKEQILLKKKEEKLNLFSRSHFSNLENTIPINFL